MVALISLGMILATLPQWPPTALANPGVDFSKERWVWSGNTLTHQVQADGKSVTATYAAERGATGNGQMTIWPNQRPPFQNYPARLFRLSRFNNQSLPSQAKSIGYYAWIANPEKGPGEAKVAELLVFLALAQIPGYVGNVAAIQGCSEATHLFRLPDNENVTCFKLAQGDPSSTSTFSQYITATAAHLSKTWKEKKGILITSPELSARDIPKECQEIFIPPNGEELLEALNGLVGQVDPKGQILGQNPYTDPGLVLDLYHRVYATKAGADNKISDIHVEQGSGYSEALQQFQKLVDVRTKLWTSEDIRQRYEQPVWKFLNAVGIGSGAVTLGAPAIAKLGERGEKALITAASRGANRGVVGQAIKRGIAWFGVKGIGRAGQLAGAVSSSRLGLYGLLGYLAVITVDGGISYWQGADNQALWGEIPPALFTLALIDNHIAFHQCLVENGVTKEGFTEEALKQELKNFEALSKMIREQILEIFEAATGAPGVSQSEDPCTVAFQNEGGVFQWLAYPVCGALNLLAFVGAWFARFSLFLLLKAVGFAM